MGKDEDLLEAARNGNVAVVEKILGQRAKRSGPLASLRRGPGVNARDSSGFSCLHHAALNGHKEIVKLLLDHDAYTNIIDSKGSTPLHLAAWSGNTDIVKLLLNAHITCDVNLKTKDDETALHCGAQYGHTIVVGMLLERGCDPGVRNIRGENALDLAAQYGRLETVELLVRMHPILIQQMVRVIPGTVFPHTPLHLASRNGHKMVVEVLLRSGLDANIRTPAGTALHEAALCGKIEVVRTLLEYGVDIHIRDAHNYTVKDLLRQFPAHATQEIMALLKRHKKLRASHFADSDGEGFSQPFPPISHLDSELGSPYENVRSCSRGRSMTTDPSPGSSPHRWDFHRQARSVDCVEDRRISGTSMESDNSLYQIHCAPKQFMDSSVNSDDIFMCNSRESDRISLSSTASSTGYPRRPDSSGATPLYMPMNMLNSKGAHSPCSNNKVSPTPPKKPPRRNLSVSPTHLHTIGADGYSNNAYEFLFLAHSGTKSQDNLDNVDQQESRRERLMHGRSVDQYVEMNTVFSINLDDDEGAPMPPPNKELQRGKSEDLDTRRPKPEPVAIAYENVIKPNPKRKLRRNPDQYDRSQENVYEDYDLPINKTSSSAPETFVSRKFLMIKDDYNDPKEKERTIKRVSQTIPLSPTHYQQPPTPEHPPPSALQAENAIHDRIRPLSQEYKRRSKDMETETEDEYLLIFDGSSGSFSSSVSLSDKSTDNVVEEYYSDAPFAGKLYTY